ncbi:MAG: DNA polymerase [Proteobacteria bacterium]|nr:DNA polymerase [Pseudomonadota bacterium]
MDKTVTIPRKVVCACYEDIFTGETWNFWEHDKPSNFGSHFNFENNLIVTYNATAEIGCYLNLNHVIPKNIFDVFVEIKRLYLDKRARNKFSLLDTAQSYGLTDVMTKDEKTNTRDLIINNTEYTVEQRKTILEYCMGDVKITSQVFKKIVEEIETKNKLKTEDDFKRELWQIMFRGATQACVAKIERNGFPIDNYKLNLFNNYWPLVKDKIISELNKDIDCFEDNIFNNKKFESLIIDKLKIKNWPRLFRSGQLSTNKKILEQYADQYPELQKLLEVRKLQNMTKLSGYQMSEDGRARCSLNMFGSITGRAQPSTAKFPFSTGKWARNFIRAPLGSSLAYLDYSQQEVAIQGYLSKDQKLIEAYNMGDVYLATGKSCGMIPENGTKESHPKERETFKVLFLANSYGAGEGWIADTLKIDIYLARHYKKLFKKVYSIYYKWIENFINDSFLYSKMTTCYGWQRYLSYAPKRDKTGKLKSPKNSIQNWPIQSHGSEILRQAVLDLTENNFKIIATVHDAVLIEVPLADQFLINEAAQIMTAASVKVVGGPIRVGIEIITKNYIQRDEEIGKKNKNQIIYEDIFREIGNYIKNHKPLTSGQEPLSIGCEVSV